MAYKYKALIINGKRIDEHRYIMQQHLGRVLTRHEVVHHINGDKMDNRIENIEILSPEEHSYKHKIGVKLSKGTKYKISKSLTGRKHSEETKLKIGNKSKGRISSNRRKVDKYSKDNIYICTYNSIKEAAEDLNSIHAETYIQHVCSGKRKTTCGFIWKYSE